MDRPDREAPRLPARVKRLYLLMTGAIDEIIGPHGLGRSQWIALSHVHRAGTLGQKDLASAMRIEPGTLTGLVDTLVAKGWLERLENPADKRGKVLRFTDEGHARWHGVPDPISLTEAQMLDGMTAEERARVAGSIEMLIDTLERRREA